MTHQFHSISLLAALAAASLSPSVAFATDPDGKYSKANPEMAKWFEQLRSPAGEACCALSDGNTLQDSEWRSRDGHYEVFIRGDWVLVPDSAVIAEPNLYGRTVVWPYYENGRPSARCFLPGSMM
jgi:hypothetical protein